jgi:excisionase family DNA binding protein
VAATVEELAAMMERLERKLDTLLERERPRRRNQDAELLSKREAARRLGVDRCTTLEALVAHGHVATVPAGREGVRIPRSEVERLVREGIPNPDRQPRPNRRRPPAARAAAVSLRSIKLDDI